MSKVNKTGRSITVKRLLELQGKTTLRVFSGKCGIGQSTMHNYLHGRDIKGTMLVKIAKSFGRTTDWLLGMKDMTPAEKANINLNILANEVGVQQTSMNALLKEIADVNKASANPSDVAVAATKKVLVETFGGKEDRE